MNVYVMNVVTKCMNLTTNTYIGNYLTTTEFFFNDEEVGHIRYKYFKEQKTKKELLSILSKSENTRDMIDSLPSDKLDGNSMYIHHIYTEKDFRKNRFATKYLEFILKKYDLNQIVLAYDESFEWLVEFYIKNISENYLIKDNVILFTLNND